MITCKTTTAHKYEEFRKECPFCWSEKTRQAGRTPPPLKLTQDERIHNFYPSLAAEYEKAKTAKVPMSFTKDKPDTPESKAAKRQLEISKGIDVPNWTG